MGMNQGDLPSFQNVMTMGYQGLKESSASIRHMILFSDGDPGAPSDELMASFRAERITVSTVLIAGHAGPDTMIEIAEKGDGRFYNITNPAQLPQIFLKETAVILKTAIYEEPFTPQQVASSEALSGFASRRLPAAPRLRGHQRKTARRDAAAHRAGRPAPGALAVRPRPRGGVHLRRPRQMGQPMDRLGQIPDVLVATSQLEPAPRRDRRPLGGRRHRAGQRHHQRRGDGRRRQLSQLPRLAGRRRRAKGRTPTRPAQADGPRPLRCGV